MTGAVNARGAESVLILALPNGRILGEGMPLLRRLGLPPRPLVVGHCHLAVAAPTDGTARKNVSRASHVRVATKYPEITRRHFAARGVQAECIKLNGAVELAPNLGLCRHIVDLVQTGATLKANGLIEIERIAEGRSRLIVNRPALKTRASEVGDWIERFRQAIDRAPSPPLNQGGEEEGRANRRRG